MRREPSSLPIKVVAFDLGDTLVEYEGLPLSWDAQYGPALERLAESINVGISAEQVAAGAAVLRRYNTRLHPRTHEIAFGTILADLLPSLGIAAVTAVDELAAAKAFFAVFRQRLRIFPEVEKVLRQLRCQQTKIGVFTDVPYGMPRELVVADIRETGLTDFVDVLVTSRDVGYRKPARETLRSLADQLGCAAPDLVYVGNERKDVEVAQAFGCRSILIHRAGPPPDWGQDRTFASLTEIVVASDDALYPAT